MIFKWNTDEERTQYQREDAVRALLRSIPAEDVEREGLLDTPKRVAKMYNELFSGYTSNVEDFFKSVFHTENQEMVIVKEIDYHSLCEHHMVPFFGRVHIGYVPDGKVLGLSKFARLVEHFSRRLQIQEQMTFQIAEAIEKFLKPKGVMVVVEGKHLCMSMRGVQKLNSVTITNAARGIFLSGGDARIEFFNSLSLNKNG